ncbi:hypothetical protein ACJ7VE_03375 [Streptomyces sp. PB17]
MGQFPPAAGKGAPLDRHGAAGAQLDRIHIDAQKEEEFGARAAPLGSLLL